MEENKIYNKFLVLFMWEKAKKLKQVGCDVVYFTKELEKHIMSWSEIKAREIYSKIKTGYAPGLNITTCPFCLYYQGCSQNCFYGKLLGYCSLIWNNENTWKEIITFYRKKTKSMPYNDYNDYMEIDFSKEFYENLIERLEKDLKIPVISE